MTVFEELQHLLAKNLLTDEYVSVEEGNRRFEICKDCDRYQTNNMKCGVCDCFMDIKTTLLTNINPTKLRTEKTHCPLGRWGDIETANFYRQLDGLPLIQQIQTLNDVSSI